MTSLALPSNAAAAPYSPNGPAEAPRLVRQRRIRRGWVGLGVLAIVLAALGSATLFRAIGPSHEYLALDRDVSVGAEITRDDLRVVRLNSTPGLSPVPAGDADHVVGSYAAVPLVAGTLVTPDQLTTERVPAAGEQLVAITLSRDRLPGRTVTAGDPVLLVSTRADADEDPVTFPGRVHDVDSSDGRGNDLVVTVRVPESDAATIANLAANGRIAITLLPKDDS